MTFQEKLNLKYGEGRYSIIGEYKNNKTKVLVRCNKCGYEWSPRPDNMLHCVHGCPKCAVKHSHDAAKMTTEEFIERAKELYGDRYSYEKTDSMNRDKKGRVCITCNICGKDFWENPNLFLSDRRMRSNCPNCVKMITEANKERERIRHENYLKKSVHDTESFIRKLETKFPGFYDTKDVSYTNHTGSIILYHDGKKIITTPLSVLSNKKPVLQNKVHNTETFIEKARKVHGDKYDYSKVEWVDSKTDIIIICKKHGEFKQNPNRHLSGNGCPYCNNSKLEDEIQRYLEENSIKYISRCNKKYLSWLGRQHLDFYLPEHKIAIECQGRQHFEEMGYFDGLEANIKNDFNKRKKCKENKVKILYFFPEKTKLSHLYNEEFKKIYNRHNSFVSKEKLLKHIIC